MLNICKINNLNIIIDKKYELLLALMAVYVKNYPKDREEFDFIESPEITYVEELNNLMSSCNFLHLIEFLKKLEDCSLPLIISIGLNDNFDIDEEKMNYHYLQKCNLAINDVEDFVTKLKEFAIKIGWDDFFDKHSEFYKKTYLKLLKFPKNLDLNDINNFYGKNIRNFYFIPSILINGGFGLRDGAGNNYYNRGFIWNKEIDNFNSLDSYLTECLFHEFSHPIVNTIVDKYYNKFKNLDLLYNDSIENGLPKCYRNKKTMLYEYFVRANAFILNSKYYSQEPLDDWNSQIGFNHLQDIIDFTATNLNNYKNYEDFFKYEMIEYISNFYTYNINRKK